MSTPTSDLNGVHQIPPPVRPSYLKTDALQTQNLPFSQVDQMQKIVDTIRSRDVKIAVIKNMTDPHWSEEDRAHATGIATELNKMLSGSKALVYEYAIRSVEGWLEYLRNTKVTYYIFVELPPFESYSRSPENDFFDPRSQRITEVVVVRRVGWRNATTPRGTRITAYTPVHYLEKFLHLEGSDREVAAMALCHFALSCPVPHQIDKAYWSQWPKVVQVEKTRSSLGLAITTREMAPKSEFPRIVLVKSINRDCVQPLRDRIGKYTHIQSFNGILLDGLDISDVTSIIQSYSHMSYIQLVVRYVHPLTTETNTVGITGNMAIPPTPVTPQPQDIKPAADRINPLNETLPIPLMILGDMRQLCKELFKCLSVSDGDSLVGSGVGARETTTTTEPLPARSSSASLHVPTRNTRSETSNSSYDSDALFQSDKYITRSSISRTLFNNSNLSSPITPIRVPQNPPYVRQPTYPSIEKRYILNMLRPEMDDRKLNHLFLRPSGIYLIVVSMEEIYCDPVIQFENLSFYIRMVQTYVPPRGTKRIMIVGISDGPIRNEQESDSLSHLEGAIHESNFHHVHNKRDGTSVILFDRQNVKASLENLCQNISKCVDVMMNRTWHMDPPFFKTVFQPFTGLTDVLSSLNKNQDVTMSSDSLLSLYDYADPNYFDTLAAYSSACISVTERLDSLLRPGFLVDLLRKLSLKSDMYREAFQHEIPLLKNLPIVLSPWPKAQILTLGRFSTHQQDCIIKWAEHYELLYSLGYHIGGKHEMFFIPALATEFLSEDASYDWPDSEDWYEREDVNILYARLNFSAIDYFFYGLLTEILRDIVKDSQRNPTLKCYINYGCMEAIMPIHVKEVGSDISVYVKYHRLQNVIEFRTGAKNKQLYLYKAADSKLSAAFNQSKYYNRDAAKTYRNAVTFHIPCDIYDPRFVASSIGKLCNVQQPSRLDSSRDGEEGEQDQLLKMKPVTDTVMKNWESSKQEEKKKIPAEHLIKWGRRLSTDTDSWAIVGSKLNLLSRDEVNFYRSNPRDGGNGSVVLRMWGESNTLTFKDLTDTLRTPEVRLEVLADEIETFFGATGTEV